MAAPVESLDLEALVRDELRGPVTELVRRLIPELVAEARNGALVPPPDRPATTPLDRVSPAQDAPAPAPATTEKVCTRCGEAKPLAEFERSRRTCRACRRDQERARAHTRQAEEAAHPFGGTASPTLAPANPAVTSVVSSPTS